MPSVTQTCAPVGQTPILREWWARDHLSTISAISPAGKLYFHAQEGAINPVDVTALLEHLRRIESGTSTLLKPGLTASVTTPVDTSVESVMSSV